MEKEIGEFIDEYRTVPSKVWYCAPLLPPFAGSIADVEQEIKRKQKLLVDEFVANHPIT